jgi:DNA-binding Xre family transcriptional regulator
MLLREGMSGDLPVSETYMPSHIAARCAFTYTARMSPLLIRLREEREAQRLSQGELADLAGTHQATISLLESGKTRRVDLDLIERIAKALGVAPESLFVGSPAPRAPRRRHK